MSTRQRDLATDLEEWERLRKLGIDQEDESVCADISKVVSQRAFFDSNGCRETYHGFHRVNGRVEVFHSNNELCGVSEYFLPLEK